MEQKTQIIRQIYLAYIRLKDKKIIEEYVYISKGEMEDEDFRGKKE